MDFNMAQEWLDRYVEAWLSYDPVEIAGLFSADVNYRYHPFDEPTVGLDLVVASWLGEASEGTDSTRDAPGTYEAEFSPVAVDGDTVVAVGETRYCKEPGGPVVRTYANCFVMRFDGEGRCREFTEFYSRHP